MVQVGEHVDQLDDVAEVLHRPVAAATVEIGDEGRPIVRGEHGAVAANTHRALRVAGVLDELRRSRRLDNLAAQTLGELDEFAFDGRPGIAPQVECVGVLLERDADLGQDPFGVVFDLLGCCLGQHIKRS